MPINLEEGDGWSVDINGQIFYTCTLCGYEMAFMGNDVCCEECGNPMNEVPQEIIDKYEV